MVQQQVQIPPSVRIGANILMEVQTPEGQREYKSRVEDIEDGTLVIAMPSERGELVMLNQGEYCTLNIMTVSAAQVFAEGEIIGRRAQPVPLLVIHPFYVETRQQRTFHRVQVRIEPMGVWWWTRPEDKVGLSRRPSAANKDGGWQSYNAVIVDLSGGGLGLLASEELPRGTNMFVRFPLPVTQELMEVRGRITSSRARPKGDQMFYLLGIQFEGLSQQDQERIVKANTRHQIEERRKGLGR